MAKKTTAAVEKAIRVIELAAQEGLFGKYAALAALAAGGIRIYLQQKSPKEIAMFSRAIAKAMGPKKRKPSKRYRDSVSGLLVKAKTAQKRPGRHTLETM